jgi:hypothetical protein
MDDQTLTSDELVYCLEQFKRHYELGIQGAALEAISLCAHYNLLMPEWLRYAFIEQYNSVRFYDVGDWTSAFGPARRKGKLKDLKDDLKIFEVRDRILSHISSGGSLNEESFDELAKEMNMGATKFKRLWREAREFNYINVAESDF